MKTDKNHKRVERVWRGQGLKLPRKQQKKRRLWLTDGQLHPSASKARGNHVWSYDFAENNLLNGRKIRWLNIINEFIAKKLRHG